MPMPTLPIPLLLLLLSLLSLSTATTTVLLRANATLQSPSRTFSLSFISPDPQLSNYYLAISYTSLPPSSTPPVWVANRRIPLKDPSSAALSLSSDGRLSLSDAVNFIVWQSPPGGANLSLSDSGNLLLLSAAGAVVWQSFDSPSDTWLPGMNLTAAPSAALTSWASPSDPSPGRYSLRLSPPSYGQISLFFNGTTPYWSSGDWTGDSFSGVPQMTIHYIYRFYFDHPFTRTASFGFAEVAAAPDAPPPLTRFHLSPSGELRQYTWNPQAESWNTFWAQPPARCDAFGLCGPFGVCRDGDGQLTADACACSPGFQPSDSFEWGGGDFSGGCERIGRKNGCNGEGDDHDDVFAEVVGGAVGFDRARTVSFEGVDKTECQRKCLRNCSCVGVVVSNGKGNGGSLNSCKNLFGDVMNIRNSTNNDDDVSDDAVLYLRVGRDGLSRGKNQSLNHEILMMLIGVISGLVAVSIAMGAMLLVLRTRRRRREREEAAALDAAHLRVFSYKELHAATRGFSEKLGHGGFGTVFAGVLPDSSRVAVKRLERPGNGGEKEFRAEVCTIGNVQHVNLVRLRGFCSESSHRLLVYDYMPNGPLSGFLKTDGLNMGWEVRFRVAVGTARALAYLHEECRDCIIHCDIKPENILLDASYAPKVSDFGLAKLVGRDFSRVLATMRGTWGYVAPEWISGLAITAKADVYSYGMTMLELIGGRRNVLAPRSSPSPPPQDGGADGEKWFFPPWAARKIVEGKVAEVVDHRLGLAYDRAEAERLARVAVWCIQDEEGERPSMGMVVKMLEGVVEVGLPPPPKLLQALVSGDSFPGVAAGVDSDKGGSTTGGGDACSDDDIGVSVHSDSSSSHGNSSPIATNASV